MDSNDPLSLNLYTYCHNNPVRFVDPSGHVITEWDLAHLSQEEIDILIWLGDMWNKAPDHRDSWRQMGIKIRSNYLMPYEVLAPDGNVYIDADLMRQFELDCYEKYGSKNADWDAALVAAGAMAIADSPLVGPFDVAASFFLLGTALQSILSFAGGKGNPKDLENGMNDKQREMFYWEIHNYKDNHGMRPDDNIPWPVLVGLAKLVRELYK